VFHALVGATNCRDKKQLSLLTSFAKLTTASPRSTLVIFLTSFNISRPIVNCSIALPSKYVDAERYAI
jgi:hypothetical protein